MQRPFVGHVRIAVFAHPRCTGQQLVVAAHVEQRHLADHRLEEVGPLHRDGADQQAAVAAAHDAEVRRRRDAPFAIEVFGDGDEVVVRALPVLLQRGFVPVGTELAAAADAGDDEDAAALEPGRAGCRRCTRAAASGSRSRRSRTGSSAPCRPADSLAARRPRTECASRRRSAPRAGGRTCRSRRRTTAMPSAARARRSRRRRGRASSAAARSTDTRTSRRLCPDRPVRWRPFRPRGRSSGRLLHRPSRSGVHSKTWLRTSDIALTSRCRYVPAIWPSDATRAGFEQHR